MPKPRSTGRLGWNWNHGWKWQWSPWGPLNCQECVVRISGLKLNEEVTHFFFCAKEVNASQSTADQKKISLMLLLVTVVFCDELGRSHRYSELKQFHKVLHIPGTFWGTFLWTQGYGLISWLFIKEELVAVITTLGWRCGPAVIWCPIIDKR